MIFQHIGGIAGSLFVISAALFTEKPGGIDASQLWQRADIGVSDSPVLIWKDYPSNDWDTKQSDTTYQPTSSEKIVNFNPTLYFSDHFLDVLYNEVENSSVAKVTDNNPLKLNFNTLEANSSECGYFEVELI